MEVPYSLVFSVTDVNLLAIARPTIRKSQVNPVQNRAKNGQMIRVSRNPASPDDEPIDTSILPPTKMDKMLNNSHSSRLPMPNPTRRNLKRDFLEIFLLSMTTLSS